MRKIKPIMCLLLVAALGLTLFGCGSSSSVTESTDKSSTEPVTTEVSEYAYDLNIEDNGMFTGVKALDYVTLPEDIDVISFKDAEVSSDETTINEMVTYVKQNYGEHVSVSTPAAVGNGATIDFVGKVDGVIFQGGSAQDAEVLIGSGKYLADFENGLIGHSAGETFDVDVLFPDGYGSSQDINGNPIELSNKTAVFTMTIKDVYDFELNAENIEKALSESGLAITTTYPTDEAGLRELLADQNKLANRRSLVEDYLLENCTVSEIPQAVLDSIISYEGKYILSIGEQYGYTDVDMIVQAYGYGSFSEYIGLVSESIRTEAQNVLIRQAVAEYFGITADDEAKIATFGSLAAYETEVATVGTKLANQETLFTAAIDHFIK